MHSPKSSHSSIVSVRKRLRVSAEVLFDAFATERAAFHFLFGGESRSGRQWQVMSRSGDSFSIVGQRDGAISEYFGSYLEVDRHSLVVFSLSADDSLARDNRVIAELTAFPAGCFVSLHHVGVIAGMEKSVQERWETTLGKLEGSLKKQVAVS